jgi:hypothetical protein
MIVQVQDANGAFRQVDVPIPLLDELVLSRFTVEGHTKSGNLIGYWTERIYRFTGENTYAFDRTDIRAETSRHPRPRGARGVRDQRAEPRASNWARALRADGAHHSDGDVESERVDR